MDQCAGPYADSQSRARQSDRARAPALQPEQGGGCLQGYRRYVGSEGQPADYPVLRLCWALLLRYLLGPSLRSITSLRG